jgi:spore coat protein U-like protein
MNKFTSRVAALSATIALICAPAAQAATSSTNLGITTTVAANCLVSATPVAFGSYDPMAATATTSTGVLTLTCTQGSAPSVAIDLGANASAGQRRMAAGANRLPYDLFQPSANTAGASCAGASTPYPTATPGFALTSAPSIAARNFNVCAQIAPGQDVPVGSYSDTVLVTVTF